MKTARLLICCLAMMACEGTIEGASATARQPGSHRSPEADPSMPQVPALDGWGELSSLQCVGGKPGFAYRGLGNEPLELDRPGYAGGSERRRVKLYENRQALIADYNRIAFNAAEGLVTSDVSAALGVRINGTYSDPPGGSLHLFEAFRLGFRVCLKTFRAPPRTGWASHPELRSMPTVQSARTQCAAMATALWFRPPSNNELSDCETFALSGVQDETEPARHWATVCAALTTSLPFLTY